MARILVAVMPFAGHIAPMLAVVSAFVARGHSVRVYTGSAYASRFEAAGAGMVPWQDAPDFDEHALADTFPPLRGRKGPRQTLANLEHLFIRTGAAQHADLLRAWRREPWDLLLADSLSCGAVLAAETTGAPWATLSLVPLTTPSRDLPPAGLGLRPGRGAPGRLRDALFRRLSRVLTRGLHSAWNETRVSAGLARTPERFDSAWVSTQLTCVIGLASLDYPRRDLPPTTHYVGAVRAAAPPASALPSWWSDVATSSVPVVHVTQGTLNTDLRDLIRPTFGGLAGEAVLIVAATGAAGHTTLPFPTPANARVAGLLPYDDLLPHTSFMVTNGGWGGVLAALSHGIPLIVAGGDIDKPEIAARLAYRGVAVDLRTGTPTARAVAGAFRRVSGSPSYRSAAQQIAEELRRSGGAREVVERCEALLAP